MAQHFFSERGILKFLAASLVIFLAVQQGERASKSVSRMATMTGSVITRVASVEGEQSPAIDIEEPNRTESIEEDSLLTVNAELSNAPDVLEHPFPSPFQEEDDAKLLVISAEQASMPMSPTVAPSVSRTVTGSQSDGLFDTTAHIGADLELVLPDAKMAMVSESSFDEDTMDHTGSSPSGWWPHDDWLRHCAEKQSQLPVRPFPSAGLWEGYRLGDCIKQCNPCGKREESLAIEYKARACKKEHPNFVVGGNFSVVEEVLSLRDGVEGFHKPDDDELVIHLRLGDVIEGSKEDVATMLIEGGNPHHSKHFAKAIKSVYEYLADIRDSGVSKVSIIGGSHKPNYCEKSRPYAECIEESIRRAGYDVRMELDSGNPDQDFYFLSHAKKISVSTGGYSRLVGDIAMRKGAEVIGRTFPAPWSISTNTVPAEDAPEIGNGDLYVTSPTLEIDSEHSESTPSVENTTSLEQDAGTPSGWWPHNDWLQHCADKLSALPLQPFAKSELKDVYRLGDCIRRCNPCGHINGTLAVEYKARACKSEHPSFVSGGNMTVITEVLRLKDGMEGYNQPSEDELVIHLRLGDVVEGAQESVATMLMDGGNPRHDRRYHKAIKSAYEYLSDIRESGVSKVTIIGGSHKPNKCAKSRPYAGCIKESIKRAGYDVRMQLDSVNADKDFYFMSHAKKISVSTGGYSRLVGDIAVHNGGIAIGRTFPAF